MAKGPGGERRPDDPAQAAIAAVRVALGEIADELDETATTKDAAAVALGRRGGLKGGRARAEKLTPERRKEIARLAAKARHKG